MNKVRTSSQRSGATKRNNSQRSEPTRDKAKRGFGHKLFAHTHSADPMVHDEDHFEHDQPRMSLSKIFIVILLLHVLVIAGLAIMHHSNKDSVATTEAPTPAEPAGAAAVATPNTEELLNAANAQPRQGVPLAPPNRPVAQEIPYGWESTLVKSGENIDAVARRMGVQRKWLVKANADLNRLNANNPAVRVGQMLAIPSQDAILEYRVQENLAQRNALGNQTPVRTQPVERTPVVTPPVEVERPAPPIEGLVEVEPESRVEEKVLEPILLEDPQPAASGKQHKVAKGETFYGIGRKYGVSAQDLMRHNGYSNPSALGIGDVLRIP